MNLQKKEENVSESPEEGRECECLPAVFIFPAVADQYGSTANKRDWLVPEPK